MVGSRSASLGGTTSGYQTDHGLFAEASSRDGEWTRLDRLHWQRTEISLNNTNGLYRATAQTRYYHTAGGEDGRWREWSGDLAIVTANDSIWIDVTLDNPSGGNAGAFLVGGMTPAGRFEASDSEGTSRLVGTVAVGISAEWDGRADQRHVPRAAAPARSTRVSPEVTETTFSPPRMCKNVCNKETERVRRSADQQRDGLHRQLPPELAEHQSGRLTRDVVWAVSGGAALADLGGALCRISQKC